MFDLSSYVRLIFKYITLAYIYFSVPTCLILLGMIIFWCHCHAFIHANWFALEFQLPLIVGWIVNCIFYLLGKYPLRDLSFGRVCV